MWYSNDVFRYMLKAEFATLVGLKVPSGNGWTGKRRKIDGSATYVPTYATLRGVDRPATYLVYPAIFFLLPLPLPLRLPDQEESAVSRNDTCSS